MFLLPIRWLIHRVFVQCVPILSLAVFSLGANAAVPDLTWQPEPFGFVAGESMRYIDYDTGDDAAEGTRDAPWKHHPWDANATGHAAACAGIHTYVFKRGVIYRGTLVADESGTPDQPIRLTSDPTWGEGEAMLIGSAAATEGWRLATEDDAPGLPAESLGKTWLLDRDSATVPRMAWVRDGQTLTRLRIANQANWQINYEDDPFAGLPEWTGDAYTSWVRLESAEGFNVGDVVTGTGLWEDVHEEGDTVRDGDYRIIEIDGNIVYLYSDELKRDAIKKRAELVSDTTRTKILGSRIDAVTLMDEENLIDPDSQAYVGATVWTHSEGYVPQMQPFKVVAYDPENHAVSSASARAPQYTPMEYCRYYMENLPRFLDQPGEYVYVEDGPHAGRVLLRLPDDRDPNQSIVELGDRPTLIDIKHQNHIAISGLTFAAGNAPELAYRVSGGAALKQAGVRMVGNCDGITISHCKFHDLLSGISGAPTHKHADEKLDHINLTDNDFADLDESAINLHAGHGNPRARIIHVDILRNRVNRVAVRVTSAPFLGTHAINLQYGEVVEIAHNIINHSGGSGITSQNGKGAGDYHRPLIRVLVHHNKVTNSMLALQDWGGIASWQGGPSYVYNNISGNIVGYKHEDWMANRRKDWYRSSTFGPAFYFDGQYKGYLFNNIAWGKNNDPNTPIYNSTGFQEAMGFLNTVFNNTFYNFADGIHKGMWQQNRSYYLGNVFDDIHLMYFNHEMQKSVVEYGSVGYADNIMSTGSKWFGQQPHERFDTLDAWQAFLVEHQAMATETGTVTDLPILADPEKHDFRLAPDSPAIDAGAKVFVPWALYSVVGEWHFRFYPKDPATVLGEHVYFNEEWTHRHNYTSTPRNNLSLVNTGADSFTDGPLENWIRGALTLDGKSTYAHIPDIYLKADYEHRNTRGRLQRIFDGDRRRTLDMADNNFLIELYFRAEPDHTNGTLVAKAEAIRRPPLPAANRFPADPPTDAPTDPPGKGYRLVIDEQGHARLELRFANHTRAAVTDQPVNDGRWHHLIAEVDRGRRVMNLYLDGKPSRGALLDDSMFGRALPDHESLANTGDFLVGKAPGDAPRFFQGQIEFLRISRGTLTDAETTIEELYDWQFNGPFLKDFYGNPIQGQRRDAGAIEANSLTPTTLHY